MRKRRGTKLVVGVLACMAGALILLVADLLQSPVDVSPVAPAMSKADARRPEVPEPATPLDKKAPAQFQATAGRPLFTPSRRPVQRTETAAPKTEAAKLRLVGVMTQANEPPRALIRFGDEKTGKWIAEGAQLNGWRLRKVNPRSVIMEAGARLQELTLSTPRRAPAASKTRAQ
jgi:hypothetical protein